MSSPRIFISYSWVPESNKQWVTNLATRLRDDGVDVVLDQWDLKPGQHAIEFMQSMVNDPSIGKVLLVCNRSYMEKANSFKGGVGDEAQIISPQLYANTKQSRYVAIINEKGVNNEIFLPTYYQNRIYFDLSEGSCYEEEYDKLLNWAYDREENNPKPPLGTPPWLKSVEVKQTTHNNEVTLEPTNIKESGPITLFVKKLFTFGNDGANKEDKKIDNSGGRSQSTISTYQSTDLPSVLGESEELFSRFLDYLRDKTNEEINKNEILNAINYAFDSRFVAHLSQNTTASASSLYENLTVDEIDLWFKSDLLDLFLYNRAVSLMASPANRRQHSKRPCLYIPIDNSSEHHGLFIYGPNVENDKFTDDVKILVNALYQATRQFNEVTTMDGLKSTVFDLFKQTYHYVSDSMYEERFAIFKRDIEHLALHFEPIVNFKGFINQVNIWGVEALARKAGEASAPVDIFHAAELWGVKFQTEVDITIMKKALAAYKSYMKSTIASNHYPLSINVYPNTILRQTYREELLKQIKTLRIPGENIILEISEKALIEVGDCEKGSLETFRRIQSELINTCGINFAMDDFGTGNSSISRILKIKPKYVKIDRELLLDHEPELAKQVIKSIVDLKERKGLFAFDVIVEGLDESTNKNIPLEVLVKELQIKYIQGHLFAKATPHISPELTPDVLNRVYTLLNWQR